MPLFIEPLDNYRCFLAHSFERMIPTVCAYLKGLPAATEDMSAFFTYYDILGRLACPELRFVVEFRISVLHIETLFSLDPLRLMTPTQINVLTYQNFTPKLRTRSGIITIS